MPLWQVLRTGLEGGFTPIINFIKTHIDGDTNEKWMAGGAMVKQVAAIPNQLTQAAGTIEKMIKSTDAEAQSDIQKEVQIAAMRLQAVQRQAEVSLISFDLLSTPLRAGVGRCKREKVSAHHAVGCCTAR